MAADLDARIWAVIGASGSGKGVWIKQQIKQARPDRLIVWDFMDEYGDFARPVESLEALRRAMLKAGDGTLRARFVPKVAGEKPLRQTFEVLCELVYAFGHCMFVAEELANVTTPGWAPAAWRKMTTSGRHAAVHIIGVTQNPALVDKTFLSNCNLIHCGPLREHRHRQAVARSMDCPIEKLTALQKLQWIERDHDARELREGWVKLPGAPRRRPPTATATGSGGHGQPPDACATVPPSKPAPEGHQPKRSPR